MAGEVITVYPGQEPPQAWDACVLIGSGQGTSVPAAPWQHEVITLLRDHWTGDGRLVAFVAEPGGRERTDTGDELADWYGRAFDVADFAMFWWPDDVDPRLIPANLAACRDNQRVVLGAPPDAPHHRYLLKYGADRAVITATTLAGIVGAALGAIGTGARRKAGEREVPLPVWRTESFQHWYSAQLSAGNTLLGARQVWTFGSGTDGRLPWYWALHVRIHVRAENRVKANEVVISRPDISAVVLYQPGASVDDATIVLVREFRSPASTPDGLVHELPGGSGAAGLDALAHAVRETTEETGLAIDSRRMRAHGSRQLAGTMSAHHAHLFSAEITGAELARLRATQSTPHGIDDEQTWTEITTFAEIRRDRLVDWATLGMIAEALLDGDPRQPGASAGIQAQGSVSQA